MHQEGACKQYQAQISDPGELESPTLWLERRCKADGLAAISANSTAPELAV